MPVLRRRSSLLPAVRVMVPMRGWRRDGDHFHDAMRRAIDDVPMPHGPVFLIDGNAATQQRCCCPHDDDQEHLFFHSQSP